MYYWLSNKLNGRWAMILGGSDDRDIFYGTISNDARNGQPLAKYLPQFVSPPAADLCRS